jgi:hypothetical protein
MKKKLILFKVMITTLMYSQTGVGINTIYPLGEFHIDGLKNNGSSPILAASLQRDDVVVENAGKLGIGTVAPIAKIDIKSSIGNAFRLVDGTQGEGKLLSSVNTYGEAVWGNRISTKIVPAEGSGFSGDVNSDMKYISRKITLEPGRWMIKTNLLLCAETEGTSSSGFYARFGWAESINNQYVLTPDAVYGNNIGGEYVFRYGIAAGATIVNNVSSFPKTYYLITRTPVFWGGYNPTSNWNTLGSSGWGETSIIAFPAN